MGLTEAVGWLATAVFTISYFAKQPKALRRIQGLAACIWATYGVLIASRPIVVANLIVASVAIWSSFGRPTAPARRPVGEPARTAD